MSERPIVELLDELDRTGSAAAARAVAQRLRAPADDAPALRVALLSSFTVEPLDLFVEANLLRAGLPAVRTYVAPFNHFRQEILDPASGYRSFGADLTWLILDTDTALPQLRSGLPDDGTQGAGPADELIGQVRGLLDERARCSAPGLFILSTLVPPVRSATGWGGAPGRPDPWSCVEEVNRRLRELATAYAFVRVFPLDRFAAWAGHRHLTNPRLQYLAQMLIDPALMQELALRFAGQACAALGRTRKCVVVDLDNTLWGGILGEDGYERIRVGGDYPGNAYADLQRFLSGLKRRGFLLAINSKNNAPEALDALARHPGMLLRPEDFAALRINWTDKAENIRQIAAELNIGRDAIVFLDDNPAERERVRRELPEVAVPDLPDDPALWLNELVRLPYWEAPGLTAEDLRRTELYQQEAARRAEQMSAVGLDDYLEGLRMGLTVGEMGAFERPRLAQLTQKTNQFNLTTRRYQEADLARMQQDGWGIYWASLRDKFGDAGIIALALVDRSDRPSARLDVFLMSCRVIGRDVEKAFLGWVMGRLRSEGFTALDAEYIPSGRNELAAGFLPAMGFAPAERAGGLRAGLAAPRPETRYIRIEEEVGRG